MNPSYFAIFMLLFIVLMQQNHQKKQKAALNVIKKKRSGMKMTVILNGYEGKNVTVYTLNDSVTGKIVEVSDGWIKIDTGKEVSAVNLDYVIRVKERFVKKKEG